MREKILIIEDEADLSTLLAVRLQKAGFEVVIANDGLKGYAMAVRERPDTIILDLMLPGLPGEEVCREIRKDVIIGNIPIIMLTAKDNEVDRIIGHVIGANSYITKPFEIEKVLEEIGKVMKKCETSGKK